MLDHLIAWIGKINRHRTKSFWLALSLVIVFSLIMRPSSACLYSTLTPRAIVDFELAYTQERAREIKQIWNEQSCNGILSLSAKGTEAAIVNITLDFAFIVAYTWFFIVLIVLSQTRATSPKDKQILFWCYAAMAAGILDIVENIFMLIYLVAGKINSMLFAIPATMKFIIIVIIIVWLLVCLIRRIYISITT